MAVEEKSPGVELAWMQSRPVTSRKHDILFVDALQHGARCVLTGTAWKWGTVCVRHIPEHVILRNVKIWHFLNAIIPTWTRLNWIISGLNLIPLDYALSVALEKWCQNVSYPQKGEAVLQQQWCEPQRRIYSSLAVEGVAGESSSSDKYASCNGHRGRGDLPITVV